MYVCIIMGVGRFKFPAGCHSAINTKEVQIERATIGITSATYPSSESKNKSRDRGSSIRYGFFLSTWELDNSQLHMIKDL